MELDKTLLTFHGVCYIPWTNPITNSTPKRILPFPATHEPTRTQPAEAPEMSTG